MPSRKDRGDRLFYPGLLGALLVNPGDEGTGIDLPQYRGSVATPHCGTFCDQTLTSPFGDPMKLKSIALALALSAGSSAMAATCTSTFSLGSLGYGESHSLGNSFSSVQSFTDCYLFSIDNDASNALGFTVEWDFFGFKELNIDLTSVTLSGGGLTSSLVDLTPGMFAFSNLQSGSYQLALAGDITKSAWGPIGGSVEYFGRLGITPAVPEPEALAMLALGFGFVTWGSRRKS